MSLDKDFSKNNEKDPSFGRTQPSKSFRVFMEQEIKHTEDLRKNLGTEYDKSTHELFERNALDKRNELKGKLKNMADPDYEYLNRSEMRRNLIEDTLRNYTKVAEDFQEARETNTLNRPKVTDSIEDLLYSQKNVLHIIDRSSKK